MTWLRIVLVFGIFMTVVISSYWLLQRWVPDARDRRLQQLVQTPSPRLLRWWTQQSPRLSELLHWLSDWATPKANSNGKDIPTPDTVRLRLTRAGFRQPQAPTVFYGLKTALSLLLPTTVYGLWWLMAASAPVGVPRMTLLLIACALGYYLPDLLVYWLTTRRQARLLRSLPDALDLLRICVQSGLGLDAAIERVGRDMQISQGVISEEFALTGLELRAGLTRAAALQHLSDRMGLRDMESLVAVLIQADRFGSSISDALVLYSQAMRAKRRLMIEESAAKLPVKLLLPLIFFIFPSLLTVLLGPVVISFQQHFQGVGG
jgi:tight adherence protein C